jgi:hypothetical protein
MTRNPNVHSIFTEMFDLPSIPVRISSPRERTATVAPWGFDMDCSYEYDEGEPPTIQYGEFDHPGSPANVALLSCRVGGVDITEMLDLDRQERIEEAILNQLED